MEAGQNAAGKNGSEKRQSTDPGDCEAALVPNQISV
jgi:hypothetical protein